MSTYKQLHEKLKQSSEDTELQIKRERPRENFRPGRESSCHLSVSFFYKYGYRPCWKFVGDGKTSILFFIIHTTVCQKKFNWENLAKKTVEGKDCVWGGVQSLKNRNKFFILSGFCNTVTKTSMQQKAYRTYPLTYQVSK